MLNYLNIKKCNPKSVSIHDIHKWEEKDCHKVTGVQKKQLSGNIVSYCANVTIPRRGEGAQVIGRGHDPWPATKWWQQKIISLCPRATELGSRHEDLIEAEVV